MPSSYSRKRIPQDTLVRYVDNPHVPEQHEAKIDEIMATLQEHFHDKDVEIEGSR